MTTQNQLGVLVESLSEAASRTGGTVLVAVRPGGRGYTVTAGHYRASAPTLTMALQRLVRTTRKADR